MRKGFSKSIFRDSDYVTKARFVVERENGLQNGGLDVYGRLSPLRIFKKHRKGRRLELLVIYRELLNNKNVTG